MIYKTLHRKQIKDQATWTPLKTRGKIYRMSMKIHWLCLDCLYLINPAGNYMEIINENLNSISVDLHLRIACFIGE